MEFGELEKLEPEDRVTSSVYPGEQGRVLSANSQRLVIDWDKSGVLDHQGSFARYVDRILQVVENGPAGSSNCETMEPSSAPARDHRWESPPSA